MIADEDEECDITDDTRVCKSDPNKAWDNVCPMLTGQ